MSKVKNRTKLSVVKASVPDELELPLIGVGRPRAVRIVERDVSIAKIDVLLFSQFALLGIGDDGLPLTALAVVWRGAKKVIQGVPGALVDGTDIVLPRGTIAQWQAQAA